MKTIDTQQILKELRTLKQKKDTMTPEQYLKELVCLKIELLSQFEDPDTSKEQEIKLALVYKAIKNI